LEIWFFFQFSTFHIFHENFNNFEKKNIFNIFQVFWWGTPPKSIQGWIFFLGLLDPNRNRLASTAYFTIVSSMFCMHRLKNWLIDTSKSIFFFKIDQIYMRDAECVESKEKLNFRFYRFLVIELWSFFTKNCQFSMNFHDNSKNINRNIDFPFDSAHCASFMKVGSKLKVEEGGGAAHP